MQRNEAISDFAQNRILVPNLNFGGLKFAPVSGSSAQTERKNFSSSVSAAMDLVL